MLLGVSMLTKIQFEFRAAFTNMGRGIGTETCEMDNVFLPDNL